MRRLLGFSLGLVTLLRCSPTAADWQVSRAASGSMVLSPQVDADRRVTFRLNAPNATAVDVIVAPSPSQASRNFGTKTLPMRKEAERWTVTTDPLAPDIYSYQFRVDGKTLNDPANTHYIEEFGDTRTSTFSVPGALWTTTGAPAGRITQHRYNSGAIGGLETYSVYVPSGYDAKRAAPYPTLYLLHGAGDSARTWITNGGVEVTLNNLIGQAKAKPMVVVMPLGYGAPDGVSRLPNFEKALLDELIPQVETAYRVSRDPNARAIAGVSMGGAQAMSIGLRHPETFAWVGSFSAATFAAMASANPSADPTKAALEPKRFALVYISCGADDPILATHNRQVSADLNARGFRVTSIEVPGMGHVWPLWRRAVADYLTLVFQAHPR